MNSFNQKIFMPVYSDFTKLENGIYLNKINAEGAKPEIFDQYLIDCKSFLENLESKIVVIADLRVAKIITVDQKSQLAYFYREHKKLISEKLLGLIYVAPSAPMKITLNTVFFICSPATDYKVVSSMEVATNWARKKLISEKTQP
ncbi:hypothetical protein LVD15_07035 [Fulvivirga maritima]|uniref:hypothetical protein n=1 Tax=Fulvivirga maritima TaxID=2904247 RepID=UPI001F309BA1|nr:hypothetical protein [Fulvivirga maritima]UII28172.1 hypothetical protein LVD15_07035 [Fulvivirga maritima]